MAKKTPPKTKNIFLGATLNLVSPLGITVVKPGDLVKAVVSVSTTDPVTATTFVNPPLAPAITVNQTAIAGFVILDFTVPAAATARQIILTVMGNNNVLAYFHTPP